MATLQAVAEACARPALGKKEETMGRLMAVIAATALLVAIGGCGGGGIPSSSISIYNATTNTLISTAGATGHISVAVGDDYQIAVKRLVSDSGGTNTSEVTTVCTYHFDVEGIATANSLGVVHGVAAGDTTLEVKFQPTVTDPVDRCYLDITVTP